MASRKLLARLVRLRALEEELSRLNLESAGHQLRSAEQAMESALNEHANGRRSLITGVESMNALERTGGTVAMELATRRQAQIQPRLDAAGLEVIERRQEFFEKRTARLQVETLAAHAESLAQAEIGRRAQQMLDDWYGRKLRAHTDQTTDKSISETGKARH